MPKKAKTTKPEAAATGPEAEPVEAARAAARGSRTAAVKAALKAHPKKGPKEIAELLKAEGWDIKAQLVSVVKSAMKAKKRKKVAAPAAATEVAPAVPKDAVSMGLLVKAKKLVAQFSSIKEAKEAIAALSQLLD
jgi:hypothetical protein